MERCQEAEYPSPSEWCTVRSQLSSEAPWCSRNVSEVVFKKYLEHWRARHRITEWSGLAGTSVGHPVPTLLLKQGHPEQAAQDLVQAGLEYLQRRRFHNLPGQSVPGLRHPQREEVLPRVQLELPLLRFVPIAPCPVALYWPEMDAIFLEIHGNRRALDWLSCRRQHFSPPSATTGEIILCP